MGLKVYIGSDHRGVNFKKRIVEFLKSFGHEIADEGVFDENVSCDYPKIAYKVAKNVVGEKGSRGILLCMSGIGQAIAANKVHGARAALCYNAEAAALSRQHNDANILVLSAKFIRDDQVEEILKNWFTSEFEGGRHERRVNQISLIEEGKDPGNDDC